MKWEMFDARTGEVILTGESIDLEIKSLKEIRENNISLESKEESS